MARSTPVAHEDERSRPPVSTALRAHGRSQAAAADEHLSWERLCDHHGRDQGGDGLLTDDAMQKDTLSNNQ